MNNKPKPKKRVHSQPQFTGLDKRRTRLTSSATKHSSIASKVMNTLNASNIKAEARTGKPQKRQGYRAMTAQRAKKK